MLLGCRLWPRGIGASRKIGLTKEEIKVIACGAYLHDIGKVAVRGVILLRPGSSYSLQSATLSATSFPDPSGSWGYFLPMRQFDGKRNSHW
jgi:hypothetical protein